MKLCPQCKNTYPDEYQVCPRDQTALPAAGGEIVVGTVLRGKYEVLSELGAGGMATVYKVRHRAFQDLAAVKVVHPQFMNDPSFIKRFRNEAIVARQLKHPNAVRIDDFDYTEDGRPFIVMEFVDGRSLYDWRKSAPGAWPAERCLDIVAQAAAALGAAHTLGIVHRDIKPANILLVRGPNDEVIVKVLDFGIAKVEAEGFAGMTSVLTQPNLVIGTPEYMSPEQASGHIEASIDGRSDLYSLGLVLYEMLTGTHPFQADTPMGMLIQQVNTSPAPPESVSVVSPAVSALVLHSIQKDPSKRFQSAGEMLTALHDPEAWFARRAPVAQAPVAQALVAATAEPAVEPPAEPQEVVAPVPPEPPEAVHADEAPVVQRLEVAGAGRKVRVRKKLLWFASAAVVILLAAAAAGYYFFTRPATQSVNTGAVDSNSIINSGPTSIVNDYAGLLSAPTIQTLSASIRRADYDANAQILVVTLKSIDGGQAIGQYGLGLLNQWGVGQKEANRGVLILFVQNPASSYVGVTYGLKGTLSNAQSITILHTVDPQMRNGNYDQAVTNVVQQVTEVVSADKPTATLR